jgi:hypothetical protein
MNLLQIIQRHCQLHALAVPTGVIGSTDTQTIQLFAIFQQVIDEITTESKFNVTTQIATHTLIAAEDQGAMQTLCPSGYQFAIFETFYDRTLMRPLIGPMSESEWEALKALPTAGIMYKFRILQDHLLINPVPASPFSEIAWEYMSSWGTKSAAGVLKAAPTADDDVFVFPDNILIRGLSFRWKQIKGLPYQADETAYWNMLNNYIAKDKVKRRLNVSSGTPVDVKPGIFVPSNSWPV